MGFQSTPVITDGRTPRALGAGEQADSFNPRPSSLTGEHGCCRMDRARPSCFNPRPSSLTGEHNSVYKSVTACNPVSIHARHH